jgi:hypothetical protein
MCSALYRLAEGGPLRLLVGYEDGSLVTYDVAACAELHAAKVHAESGVCARASMWGFGGCGARAQGLFVVFHCPDPSLAAISC